MQFFLRLTFLVSGLEIYPRLKGHQWALTKSLPKQWPGLLSTVLEASCASKPHHYSDPWSQKLNAPTHNQVHQNPPYVSTAEELNISINLVKIPPLYCYLYMIFNTCYHALISQWMGSGHCCFAKIQIWGGGGIAGESHSLLWIVVSWNGNLFTQRRWKGNHKLIYILNMGTSDLQSIGAIVHIFPSLTLA